MQAATPVGGGARGHFHNPLDFPLAVLERMLRHSALLRDPFASFALVDAGGVVPDQENIHALQISRDHSAGARQNGPRLNGHEFGEQIKLTAKVVDVPSAARSAENGSAQPKNFSAKVHHLLRKPLSITGQRVFPNQRPVPHFKLNAGDLFH